MKNDEAHLKNIHKTMAHDLKNISNQWKLMNQPKTALQKQWNTLTESMKIMKNIENNNGNIEKHWEQWKLMKITLTKQQWQIMKTLKKQWKLM